jgi:exosortase
MNQSGSSIQPQPDNAEPASRRGAPFWVLCVGLGSLWIDLIRQLGHTWSSSEQYAYGWFVPLMAVGLLIRNWGTRPRAGVDGTPGWMIAGVVLVALLLLPARILHEVNPDWPLASWLLTPLVVLLSLFAFFLLGGWPWVRHFAFPLGFILIAVQWPYRIEHGLTQGLMRVVAAIGVEILGLLNVPAIQRGNLIEIGSGVLGVDEACSGIRSFQTTLMASLFLGEQYRLSFLRRTLLLLWSVLIAFGLNVVRAVLLSWNAATFGMQAVDKWHDPAGLAIVVVCFICLWSIAVWFSRRAMVDQTPRSAEQNAEDPDELASRVILPVYAYGFPIWIAVVLLGNQLWYRARPEGDLGTATRWTVTLPTNSLTFAELEIPSRSRKLLNYDEGVSGSWTTETGIRWDLYWFRWNPRSIAHVLEARVHRPDRCLPAAGLLLVQDAGLASFAAGPVVLPVRQYTYEHEGRPMHVFFCLWEDGAEQQSGMWSMYGERVRAALTGRRALGQQTLQIMVTGHAELEDAAAALRHALPSLIRTL